MPNCELNHMEIDVIAILGNPLNPPDHTPCPVKPPLMDHDN